MTHNILIVGTTYLNSPSKVELLRIWSGLVDRNSPGCDVVVIDSASPIRAIDRLPAFDEVMIEDGDIPRLEGCNTVFRFTEDIGHPIVSRNPSRDFMKGLEIAIENGYDYVVHWETDCLFSRGVSEIVEKMARSGVEVAAPFEANQQFIETQLIFFSVPYLKKSGFVNKYKRAYKPKEIFSELCVELLCDKEIFILPLRGMRNNFNLLTPDNMGLVFRHGIDWLSHCDDFGCYVEFLRMNEVCGHENPDSHLPR